VCVIACVGPDELDALRSARRIAIAADGTITPSS
jgi:hypothetical protein